MGLRDCDVDDTIDCSVDEKECEGRAYKQRERDVLGERRWRVTVVYVVTRDVTLVRLNRGWSLKNGAE